MAKQIIVLNQGLGKGERSINCVFWYPVPQVNRQVPRPGFKSAAPTELVSGTEQTQLEAGAILEEVVVLTFPSSYSTAEMQAFASRRYTDRATAVANEPAPRQYFGAILDSVTGWA